jgi:hypothetical protein
MIEFHLFPTSMKIRLTFLLLTTGLLTHSARAQTKTPVKPAAKPTTATAKPATKPAASKPATTKSTTVRSTTTARPAAKPATQPVATPAPATPPPATPTRVEIPGVAAQKAPSFAKGTVAANLGLGIGAGYNYGFGLGGNLNSSPAISLSVEKGILEGIGPGVISVGGLIGYQSYNYKWDILGDEYKASWTNIYIAARGAYHYNFTDNPKIDTYAGVSLAARIEKYSNNYNGGNTPDNDYGKTYLDAGIFLGGRYLVTDKVGAFAELGYDMSYLKIGVTAKF